jgi:hypothetical protein
VVLHIGSELAESPELLCPSQTERIEGTVIVWGAGALFAYERILGDRGCNIDLPIETTAMEATSEGSP